jgi:hypothetical protein
MEPPFILLVSTTERKTTDEIDHQLGRFHQLSHCPVARLCRLGGAVSAGPSRRGRLGGAVSAGFQSGRGQVRDSSLGVCASASNITGPEHSDLVFQAGHP